LLTAYGYIAIFAGISILFGLVPLFLSRLLSPRRPEAVKLAAYECGLEPTGSGWVRFHAGFYLYALAFVLFDVEVVFLYPWAVVHQQFGLLAFVEMALFLAVLGLGLLYAVRKKALHWW